MKHSRRHFPSGATLMDAVIAMSVLAIAVPLIFGCLTESGHSGQESAAETRAPWMVRICMDEIHTSRNGKPRVLPVIDAHDSFPPIGEVWALAFSETGELINKLSRAEYDSGIQTLNDRSIRYIATIHAEKANLADTPTTSQRVKITIEFPASTPAAKRRTLDFHTRIP